MVHDCPANPVSCNETSVRPDTPRESFDFVVCLALRLTIVGANAQCYIGVLFDQYIFNEECPLQDTPSLVSPWGCVLSRPIWEDGLYSSADQGLRLSYDAMPNPRQVYLGSGKLHVAVSDAMS